MGFFTHPERRDGVWPGVAGSTESAIPATSVSMTTALGYYPVTYNPNVVALMIPL